MSSTTTQFRETTDSVPAVTESYKSYLKNYSMLVAARVFIYMKDLVLIPLVIKVVGETVYGGFSLLNTVVGFLFGISSLGVSFRCNRYLPSSEGGSERGSLFVPQFVFNLIIVILLSIGFIVFYPLFNHVFFKGEVSFAVVYVLPYFVFYLLYAQTTNYFRYTNRMKYYNYSTIAFPYLHIALVLVVYAAFRTLSVNSLFGLQIVAAAIASIPLAVMILKEIDTFGVAIRFRKLLSDVRLGFPLMLVYVIDVVLSSSDRFVIAAVISVTAVGYYVPAYALGSLVVMIAKVSCVAIQPVICKAVDDGRNAEAETLINYTLKIFLLIAIPFIFGCVALSRPILVLLANSDVATHAQWVTPVVAAGALFYGLNHILSNVLYVKLDTRTIFVMNAIPAVLNIILNLVFITLFKNVVVAAITTLISYYVVFVLLQRRVRSGWPLSYDRMALLKSTVASIFMCADLYLLSKYLFKDEYGISEVVILMLFGMAIYIVTLFTMRTFSRKEMGYLKQMIMKPRC